MRKIVILVLLFLTFPLFQNCGSLESEQDLSNKPSKDADSPHLIFVSKRVEIENFKKDLKLSQINTEIFEDNHFESLSLALDHLSTVEVYKDVHILIWPDTYYGESMKFELDRPVFRKNADENYKIIIEGYSSSTMIGNPIFDGREDETASLGTLPYLFTFTDDLGIKTNLTIQNISLQYYSHGVQIRGPIDLMQPSNQGNCLIGVNFLKIGDAYTTHPGPTYSALALNHSSFNKIIDSSFIDIKSTGHPIGLHPMYIVDHSSHNKITNGLFKNYSGDAIKFRNSSHFGVVENSYFKTDSTEPVPVMSLAFYPVHKATKEECPPVGVNFKENTVIDDFTESGKSYPFINNHQTWQRDYDIETGQKTQLARLSIEQGTYCIDEKALILETPSHYLAN